MEIDIRKRDILEKEIRMKNLEKRSNNYTLCSTNESFVKRELPLFSGMTYSYTFSFIFFNFLAPFFLLSFFLVLLLPFLFPFGLSSLFFPKSLVSHKFRVNYYQQIILLLNIFQLFNNIHRLFIEFSNI